MPRAAVAAHHDENALAEFTNLLFEQVLCFRLVAHHDGVLDGHFRGVRLEPAVLRPEIDRFRVLRIEDDPSRPGLTIAGGGTTWKTTTRRRGPRRATERPGRLPSTVRRNQSGERVSGTWPFSPHFSGEKSSNHAVSPSAAERTGWARAASTSRSPGVHRRGGCHGFRSAGGLGPRRWRPGAAW